MTVAAKTPSAEYFEDGVTLDFAAPFRFLPSTLQVERISPSGGISVLTPGSQYSTAGGDTDAGGTVTLLTTIAGSRLRILRDTPRRQQADYTTNDTFPAESHEQALDRQMMIVQEQDVDLGDTRDRALMVPYGEMVQEIPPVAERANGFLAFDPFGRPIRSRGTGADAGLRQDLGAVPGATLVGWRNTTVAEKLDWVDVFVTDRGALPGLGNMDGAIAAAFAEAAAVGGRGRVVFPAVSGEYSDGVVPSIGYNVSDQVVIPARVSVVMHGPIIYDGPATKPALVYGNALATTASKITQYHHIDVWVVNKKVAPWLIPTSVGAHLYCHKYCQIHIKEVLGFDTGVVLNGDGGGFVHCNIHLGELRGNRVGMRWIASNGGWVNELLLFAGRVSSMPTPAGHAATSRYGLTMETDRHGFDNNVWEKPCFELGFEAATPESVPIVLTDASNCRFTNVRGEAHKEWVARITGNSYNNEITSTYGRNGTGTPVVNINKDIIFVDDQTTHKNNFYSLVGGQLWTSYDKIRTPDFKAVVYASGGSTGFTGWGVGAASTAYPAVMTPTRTTPSFGISADGAASISSSGFRLVRRVKLNGASIVDVKFAAEGGLAPSIRCFDAAGTLLYDPAILYAKTLNVNGAGVGPSTQFGGCYALTGVQHGSARVGFLAGVEYVEFMFGGSVGYKLYSVEFSTPNIAIISEDLLFPNKVATAKPTVTTNVPEGTMVINGSFAGTGAYAWLFAGGTWRDLTAPAPAP